MNEGLQEYLEYYKNNYPKFKVTFEREKIDVNNLFPSYIHDGLTRQIN